VPVLPSYIFLWVILVINVILLFFGLGIVGPELQMGVATIALIIPWPNFLMLVNLSGTVLGAWYIFLVLAILASVAWLIKTEGPEFYDIYIRSAKKFHPPPSKSKNSFVIISQCFFALMFFNIVVIFFVALWGVPSDSPVVTEDPVLWELFFDLANASVAEEIFTRVVYIGLPLLVVDYIFRRPKNKLHRYLVGGNFELEPVSIFLLVFSSALFGLAHYPAWGLWKVFPTFAAGLAFGYLYLKKGIHTSIILHFLFDYMALISLVFMNDFLALALIGFFLLICIIAWFFSGFAYFSLYAYRIFEFIGDKIFGYGPGPVPQPSTSGMTGSAGYSDYDYPHKEYTSYPPKKTEIKKKTKPEPKPTKPQAPSRVTDKHPGLIPDSKPSPKKPLRKDTKHRKRPYHEPPAWEQQHPYPPQQPHQYPPQYPHSYSPAQHYGFRSCPVCGLRAEYVPYVNNYFCNRCYRYIY
jgi:hypothetical protein